MAMMDTSLGHGSFFFLCKPQIQAWLRLCPMVLHIKTLAPAISASTPQVAPGPRLIGVRHHVRLNFNWGAVRQLHQAPTLTSHSYFLSSSSDSKAVVHDSCVGETRTHLRLKFVSASSTALKQLLNASQYRRVLWHASDSQDRRPDLLSRASRKSSPHVRKEALCTVT